MADQIKPRYRLGTQNMLDLAKDDATKIPERTLFRVIDPINGGDGATNIKLGEYVIRCPLPELDDRVSVYMQVVDGYRTHFMRADRLEPLI